MNGVISSVEDHGSIVIAWIELENGRTEPVYFDRRAFCWVAEAEGVESEDDLIRRPVSFDGEGMEFLDTLEAA